MAASLSTIKWKDKAVVTKLYQACLPLLQILQGSFLRPSKGALEGVLSGELLLLFDAEDVVRFATTLLPSIFPG